MTPGGPAGRKVVAGYFVSADGVAESPDRFITAWDDETDAKGVQLIETQDAVILGRRSYDEWAEFWPTSDIGPFAAFINAVPQYVATSTPLEREWANSQVIEGGLVDELRLVIAPLLAGSGKRLFAGVPSVRLETIRGTASPSGYLLVDYRLKYDK